MELVYASYSPLEEEEKEEEEEKRRREMNCPTPCHGQISDLARPAITLTRFEALRRQMCSQLQRRMLARTAVENGVGNEPSPSTRIVNSEQ